MKEYVLLPSDEVIFHTNEYPRRQWLKNEQQPLKKKGNGRPIHVCDWITETIGRLALSSEQIAEQAQKPEAQRLKSTEARKIIYPGKNYDAWWDLKQLMDQLKIAVDIFEYTHPEKVGIWIFDCSSAHEGLSPNALNVNNMNINPGGTTARVMRDTIIPLNNPPPKPSCIDTRGQPQSMVFPLDHPEPTLRGKPKGMRVVLEERKSVWAELMERRKGKVVGKCAQCKKSQVKKDAERRVAEAEAMGHEDGLTEDAIAEAETTVENSEDKWCCMYKVLSLQDDFVNEKPELLQYLESRGHMCLFLPKFHCELNPIELVWGYAKYRK